MIILLYSSFILTIYYYYYYYYYVHILIYYYITRLGMPLSESSHWARAAAVPTMCGHGVSLAGPLLFRGRGSAPKGGRHSAIFFDPR